MKITETNKKPKCPHCAKELDTILKIRHGYIIETHTIYMCPFCEKIISIGYEH